MSNFIEFLKIIVFGVVEGFTEWLPISSTGHLILVENIVHLNVSEDFMNVFRVVIQLGAILAVLVLYFRRLNPFDPGKKPAQKRATWHLWFKIVIACLPAAVIGILFDDVLDKYLYNPYVVAAMLIIYGVIFIAFENHNQYAEARVKKVSQISYQTAFYIGLFQLLALVPGTSRSGATILGAMMLGCSRTAASEFTFFLGIPVTYLYNMLAGIIRSLGDSKTPVYFLLLSSLLNIGLDFFTILGLGMGVGGPALATVISQGISAVLCLIYMIRHYPILHMKDEEWKPDGRMLGTLCSMGIPMGLQYSITAIGSVVLQTAVNSLGSMAVAAVSTGSKVSMFFCCPFDALGGTMATYAGQNVGAKKLDRVKEGLKAASLIGIVYSLIAFVILFFGGKHIALLFMDADQTEIIGRVAMFLIGNSMFYIPLTFVNVVRFTIQGMGFSTFAILAGVCEMAARSLVGFCLVPVFGFLPACFASPLAWIFADAFLIPAFFHCMKKLKVLFGETA